ncbi:hypothetical protein J5X07_08130 [Actinomyces bowdenii]|nr:hypothetical protein [Actinomyces bowdenii]
MSLQEAFAIRDSLGWQPSSQEPRYFTTKLSIDGKEDGIIFRSNEFGIKGVRFRLSSRCTSDDNDQINRLSHSSYSQYVSSLRQLWGPGDSSESDGVTDSSWTLPNGLSVSIFGMNGLITIEIESPWLTQITQEYDRIVGRND